MFFSSEILNSKSSHGNTYARVNTETSKVKMDHCWEEDKGAIKGNSKGERSDGVNGKK